MSAMDGHGEWAGIEGALNQILVSGGILNRAPPQRLPPGKQLAADHDDTDDMQSDSPLGRLAGMALWLEYTDANGSTSNRTITVRDVEFLESGAYIHAWCHLRRAARQFRSDRIIELANIETGEIIDIETLMRDMLRRHLQIDREDLEDFVRVIVFVAWSDKSLHPRERLAIQAAIKSFCHRFACSAEDQAQAMHFARMAAIEGIDVIAALKRLAALPNAQNILEELRVQVDNIIQADGRESDQEQDWRRVICRAVRAARL